MLAELSDIGVEVGHELTGVEALQASALLARVSDLFQRECGRLFESGTYTHKLRVRYDEHGWSVALAEPPTRIVSAVDEYGGSWPVDRAQVRGRELRWDTSALSRYRRPYGAKSNPQWTTVTWEYEGAIPDGVRQAVASVVGRYIRLAAVVGETAGAAAELSADDYRVRLAGGLRSRCN